MRSFSDHSSLKLRATPDPCWELMFYIVQLYHIRTCQTFSFAGSASDCSSHPIVSPLAEASSPAGFLFADLPEGDYKVSLWAHLNHPEPWRKLTEQTYRKEALPCEA